MKAKELRERIQKYPNKKELARQASVSRENLYRIVAGSNPRMDTVEKIVTALTALTDPGPYAE